MTNPVECPKCGSKAHRLGGSSVTLMMYQSFTDRYGKIHHHDRNARTQGRTCSDCGTRFSVISYNTCWCGWSGGTDKITWDDTK